MTIIINGRYTFHALQQQVGLHWPEPKQKSFIYIYKTYPFGSGVHSLVKFIEKHDKNPACFIDFRLKWSSTE